MVDGALGRGDGLLLLTGAVVYTAVLVRLGRKEEAAGRGGPREPGPEAEAGGAGGKGDEATEIPAGRRSAPVDAALVVVGVGLLVLGARLLVKGASDIALGLGVSELVVGLTVVATGTSLPEVATSLLAAWRGERDLAVGNVVGSNIFNAFFVLGAGAAVAPEAIPVPSGVLTFDVPVMLAVSLVCLPIFFTGWSISRREGVVFLLYYAAYLGYLVAHAADHPAEEVIRTGVLFYAAPLTVLTLGLILLRQLRRTPS
jgi:cation:H+ antiporter